MVKLPESLRTKLSFHSTSIYATELRVEISDTTIVIEMFFFTLPCWRSLMGVNLL